MPLFVRLARLTEQAHRNIQNMDKMLAEAKQIMETNGAKILHAYMTLGQYDVVAIIEAPDDRTAAKISAMIANQGNFKAETMAAIPIEEFIQSTKE
jgi:uncharacterized protein with GYD domain